MVSVCCCCGCYFALLFDNFDVDINFQRRVSVLVDDGVGTDCADLCRPLVCVMVSACVSVVL